MPQKQKRSKLRATVLIPSYGRPDSLRRCLAGLRDSRRKADEVIVVVRENDAPTRAVLEEFPEVKQAIVCEPGQVAAMNAGLTIATGDIVCFIDDDCVPRPDWLGRILRHYDDLQVGGVGGRDVVGGPEKDPEAPFVRRVGLVTFYGRLIGNHHCRTTPEPRSVQHLKGANMSFRRALLKPFDRRLRGPHLNDTEMSLFVWRRGYKLIWDPQAQVDHYPAPRPDAPGGRHLYDLSLAYLDAHDQAYVLVKHLPGLRKLAALFYQLAVGTCVRPGLLAAVIHWWRRPSTGWKLLIHCVAGTLAGVRTALCALLWQGEDEDRRHCGGYE